MVVRHVASELEASAASVHHNKKKREKYEAKCKLEYNLEFWPLAIESISGGQDG